MILKRAFAWFTLAVLAGAVAAGCGARAAAGKRVIVLGIDGMDYRLTAELMAQGRMPNFSRLAAAGSFGPLATTMPPQSPVAWSSVMTGLDPGGHGIFDFIHRDPATLAPYLSTARTEAPAHVLSLGTWRLPLSAARVISLRDGEPFWQVLGAHGVPTSILRMPANYPPSGVATRELSGMGTPDLLGTYGTFTFFTSTPDTFARQPMPGGRVVVVDVIDNVVTTSLAGPDDPFRSPSRALVAPLTAYLDPESATAKIALSGEERILRVGEWSDWVPVEYPLRPFSHVRGMCRIYLKQVRPAFELYVSPVNLDPLAPELPLSTPASFAPLLARQTGRFYTQGLPEDTKALNAGVFSRDEFLKQARDAGDEVTRQYWAVLDQFEDGLLFYYFGNLDQVSHMMWRARDPGHPAYNADRDARYAHVIDDLYVEFDRIVGETRRRVGPETSIVVMSDHGFTSWRRSFNLNGWLRDNGYLAVLADEPGEASGASHVDWSRTRAYGLGLNGLYVNVEGRERFGTVRSDARVALVEEIRQKLLSAIDPATGRPVVTKAVARERLFADSRHFDVAPDLIVGYAAGTRVSNESALGLVTGPVVADNTLEWSGDHCMDPDAVPGVLLASHRLAVPVPSLEAVPRLILAEFGVRSAGRDR